MIEAIGLIVVGLIALVIGGELLVRGASRLAAVVGISPLVIGLTVVAFGTVCGELEYLPIDKRGTAPLFQIVACHHES